MINGFEAETHDLTDYELDLVKPMVKGLKTKIGIEKAITNGEMIKGMKAQGHKVSPARIRKLINYIRVNRIIVNLISSSKGYWIESDPERIREYKDSLQQRINAIEQLKKSFLL